MPRPVVHAVTVNGFDKTYWRKPMNCKRRGVSCQKLRKSKVHFLCKSWNVRADPSLKCVMSRLDHASCKIPYGAVDFAIDALRKDCA